MENPISAKIAVNSSMTWLTGWMRPALIAGAFAHVHVRGKLAGFPFNAQYQWALAGIDYREHRLDARIVRGHLTAGVDLIVGRRDGDPSTYRMLAISAGFHFGS